MNLILDIGNSVAKITVFDQGTVVVRRQISERDEVLLNHYFKLFAITDAAYSCVGEDPLGLAENLKKCRPNALHVIGTTPTPLIVKYDTPETLGSDRLAASVGAATITPGRDLLIIDIGTCVTYDYVTADGLYLGGNISPRVGMRLRSLHSGTATLPLVSAEGRTSIIGKDTETAIRGGVICGILHEIEGYIRDFRTSHPQGKVFLTGGSAYLFPELQADERREDLVDTGLNTILLYNR